MKNFVVNGMLNLIKKEQEYDEDKLSIIKYGLEGIYITITKMIFIGTLAYILGMLKEFFIFLLLYNIIRTTSFGLHATKSWLCLLSSTIIFIAIPLLCKYLVISEIVKFFAGVILTLFIFKNSPADTHKKPIKSLKRRKIYKYLSTIIAILFVILSISVNNNFISNCFIFALLIQVFMISPTIYKLFKLPYNNYLIMDI